MEEKNMRELNMDEMDKVSGGVSELETLYRKLEEAGLLNEVAALPRKQAITIVKNFCNQNGLSEYAIWGHMLLDMVQN